MDWKRTTTYENLQDPKVKEFYASPETAATILDLAQKYNLDDSQLNIYTSIVGDIILGLQTKADLSEKLQDDGVALDTIENLLEETTEFVTPVVSAREQTEKFQPDEEEENRETEIIQTQNANERTGGAPETEVSTEVVAPPAGRSARTPEMTQPPAQRSQTEQQSMPPQNPDAIPALRTMQKDADRIHGYGAYRRKYPTPEEASGQQNKKNSKNSLADMPQYENNNKNPSQN